MAVANLANAIDPEVVVIGGPVAAYARPAASSRCGRSAPGGSRPALADSFRCEMSLWRRLERRRCRGLPGSQLRLPVTLLSQLTISADTSRSAGNTVPRRPVYCRMKLLLRGGMVVLAWAVASACVVSVDSQGQIVREEKRFTVDGTPDLHLATFDGAIEIQSWDKPEVLVEIEKRGPTREAVDGLKVESSQDGNRITSR